jgi:hypothetical protein
VPKDVDNGWMIAAVKIAVWLSSYGEIFDEEIVT